MYYYGLSDLSFWAAIAVGQVAFWFAMRPLIRALADRVRRPVALGEELEARIASLESGHPGTSDGEALRREVSALAERIDFAERLLSTPREQSQVSRVPG